MFKRKTWHSYSLLIPALFALVSCTDHTPPVTPASSHVAAPWYTASYNFFFTTQTHDVNGLATALTTLLTAPSDASSKTDGKQYIANNVLTRQLVDEDKQEARLAIQTKLSKQFLAHQLGSFGHLALTENDTALMNQDAHMKKYVQSLVSLSETFEVFTSGELSIYEADNTSALFAYKRSKDNTRAFVVFNFSYDTHELPLPFGFMTSTKVSIWQSDAPELNTFVTTRPISIRPFTAVILLVGEI